MRGAAKFTRWYPASAGPESSAARLHTKRREIVPVVSGFSRTHDSWQIVCLLGGMITGNPGHVKTFDYAGLHRYSLTFCTNFRSGAFTERSRVELVLEQIVRAATETGFAIVAYCFMPDHVHLVVEGLSDTSNGLMFCARAKQYSGFYFKKAFHEKLWQRYGFERTLRDNESTLGVARYVLENPVRAVLVKRVQDYPFVGSLMYPIEQILEAAEMEPPTRKSRG